METLIFSVGRSLHVYLQSFIHLHLKYTHRQPTHRTRTINDKFNTSNDLYYILSQCTFWVDKSKADWTLKQCQDEFHIQRIYNSLCGLLANIVHLVDEERNVFVGWLGEIQLGKLKTTRKNAFQWRNISLLLLLLNAHQFIHSSVRSFCPCMDWFSFNLSFVRAIPQFTATQIIDLQSNRSAEHAPIPCISRLSHQTTWNQRIGIRKKKSEIFPIERDLRCKQGKKRNICRCHCHHKINNETDGDKPKCNYQVFFTRWLRSNFAANILNFD